VDKRAFKNALYQQFARIGKALSSPHRIEMMELLAQRERTVESLAEELGLTMGNASAHLQVLREARLVEARKEGLFVHYRVADDSVLSLLESLRRTAETRLAEVDRLVQSYFGDRTDMDAIGFDELKARLKAGSVILIDVRPREEYAYPLHEPAFWFCGRRGSRVGAWKFRRVAQFDDGCCWAGGSRGGGMVRGPSSAAS
jgi:DNA-binding transcriptional ArsR family regulator